MVAGLGSVLDWSPQYPSGLSRDMLCTVIVSICRMMPQGSRSPSRCAGDDELLVAVSRP